MILENSESSNVITAIIIPHANRSDKDKAKLRGFSRTISGFDALPDVISEAGTLMGLRGYGDNADGSTFAEDVLQIKVVGPSGLHLSIVDLPGLISSASEEQSDDDVAAVHRMVDEYAENPRTIILAVVQASNDIANQSIIHKSKRFDKDGQRTVGIITKPDLINVGAEKRIAALARNQDTTKLKLGFFLLKNPTPKEREANMTATQRAASELAFFHTGAWKSQNLDKARVGINNLRGFLQTLLDRHIEQEMPKVRKELSAMIESTEKTLNAMPPERPSTGHLRVYLSNMAGTFNDLSTAALSGEYGMKHAAFFAASNDEIDASRLRALIHNFNTEFVEDLIKKGERYKLAEEASSSGQTQAITHDQDSGSDADKPIMVDEKGMKEWVAKV